MKVRFFSFISIALLLLTFSALAAPDEERLPASSGAPLEILSSQADQILVPQTGDFKNRFILVIINTEVQIVDTETWDSAVDQPTAFGDSIGGMALLGNGTSLAVTLSGGDLARVELDNIEEENAEIEDAESDDEETEDDCDDFDDNDDDGDADCDDSDCSSDSACEDIETDCDDEEDDDDDGDTDCDDSDCSTDSACTDDS